MVKLHPKFLGSGGFGARIQKSLDNLDFTELKIKGSNLNFTSKIKQI